jgi:AraC-like DNA-binding protein
MERRQRDVLARPARGDSVDLEGARPSSPGSEDSLQRAKAIDFIERNLTSRDLTPARVADAVHVSRSALYRMFGPTGGVNRYIVRARLDRAWKVLADAARARRVSEVAFDLGFQSEAHFCRVFRRAFGVTPGHVNGVAHEAAERADRAGPRGESDVPPGA